MERKGTVAQVLGPVVDVEFSEGSLPEINEALTVELDGKAQVMEVAQHIGGDTVRCIMLSPRDVYKRQVQHSDLLFLYVWSVSVIINEVPTPRSDSTRMVPL